jgi:hypothetical protein
MEANMKKFCLMALTLIVMLTLVSPVAASGPTGMIGIYSVAACQDTTTVAVSGTTTYATNRIKAWAFRQKSDGNWEQIADTVTSNFSSGDFMTPLALNYFKRSVSGGTPLRIDVQLQGSTGGGFTNVGGGVSAYVTAADTDCKDKCSVTISSTDRAPANGTVTLRSHYGSFFRPEGRLHSAVPVKVGQALHYSVVALPCNWTVRAWYYPATGKDRTPRLLTTQYWPYEFAATTDDGANPYTTSFVKSVKATAPLEAGDPYAPK